jgi:hypothetical protein
MAEQRPPRWNIVSVCTPFVGCVVGDHFSGVGVWGVIEIWAACCVIGLVAAGIALDRKERLWGLSALGIVLNIPLPLIFLAATFGPF